MTLFAAECPDARQSPRHEFRGRSRYITLKASTPELAHATTLPPSGGHREQGVATTGGL